MEVPTAKLVGQKKPDKAPINRIPGEFPSKKQMKNRNLNKNKHDFSKFKVYPFFSKRGPPKYGLLEYLVYQPLGFEDAAVMWWADFDFEDFAENSSILGADLTRYIYARMMNIILILFQLGGLRLVYDMYFRHFNVLLKILLHVQWFFPRSIVFPPNNRSNGNGRCEHVFPMKQKDCMSMAMFVYQRASIDYRYYPKASQRMQQQITTNAHRFLDKS